MQHFKCIQNVVNRVKNLPEIIREQIVPLQKKLVYQLRGIWSIKNVKFSLSTKNKRSKVLLNTKLEELPVVILLQVTFKPGKLIKRLL